MTPAVVVAVLGTATEVGKTHVTAELVRDLRRAGIGAVARKPAQSFAPDDQQPTDAEVLGAASGEAPDAVCPRHRWYPVPMAPPMAADVLGTEVPRLGVLVAELQWRAGTELGFVESVGGVRSPVAADGDSRELALAVAARLVLLVADAGLGTIDSVRLATEAIAPTPVLVHLNRFDATDDLHRRNAAWLRDVDGIDLTVDTDALAGRLASLVRES